MRAPSHPDSSASPAPTSMAATPFRWISKSQHQTLASQILATTLTPMIGCGMWNLVRLTIIIIILRQTLYFSAPETPSITSWHPDTHKNLSFVAKCILASEFSACINHQIRPLLTSSFSSFIIIMIRPLCPWGEDHRLAEAWWTKPAVHLQEISPGVDLVSILGSISRNVSKGEP